jgi:hypothetical protein
MVTQASPSVSALSMREPLAPWMYRCSPSRQWIVGIACTMPSIWKATVHSIAASTMAAMLSAS